MKKNIYSLFLVFMAMAAFTACSSNDNDYTWATVSGEQVYFSKDLASKFDLSKDETTFTVPINRVNTSGSITVNLSHTATEFTMPSSVTFDAGQSVANITVTYDPETLVYDKYVADTLTITSTESTTPYGSTTYTFSAGLPSPFESLGTGKFEEGYLWGFSGSVEIAQNQEDPDIYRVYVKDLFTKTFGEADEEPSEYIEITLMQPGSTLFGVPITQTGLVYFTPTNTGYYHETYSSFIWFYHPGHFTSMQNEAAWGFSRVLAYQEDGRPGQIQLAPRYHLVPDGRGYAANNSDGDIIITFPGFVPKDYSAELAAAGIFTDLAGNVFAAANVTFGADATNVKALVVDASADADAVADAIAAGEVEAAEIEAKSGTIYVPIEEGLSGKLQIVMVVMDDEDAIKGVYASPFEYYGGAASPWQSIGIGLYTEDFISSLFDAEPVTYEVEIEENAEHPGLYRMLSPYGEAFPYNEPGDWDTSTIYNIEVNAEDSEGVYIELQPTGVDWGYGAISILSWGARYLANNDFEEVKAAGYLGTLKDGVITLPVLERETDEGTALYQGMVSMGTSNYYACLNGAFKLVLPEAVPASARAKAQASAKARNFAKRLKGNTKGYSMKQMRLHMNRTAPLSKRMEIAK